MDLKPTLYDWNGLNEKLFYAVNGFQPGETYTQAMIYISMLSKYTIFPVYYGLALMIAWVLIAREKAANPVTYPIYRARWRETLFTLPAAYLLTFTWVRPLKDYFLYPRPFIALPEGTVHIPPEIRADENPLASFPSGHTTFATLMVAGLWPMLSPPLRLIALAYLALAMISRMALGVHFPADLLAALILSFLGVKLMRSLAARVLRKRAIA